MSEIRWHDEDLYRNQSIHSLTQTVANQNCK
jgi:hypothetical protein